MPASQPRIRLVIDLHAGRQPLAGDVVHSDGRHLPFRGWLELVAAVERARAAHYEDHPRDGVQAAADAQR